MIKNLHEFFKSEQRIFLDTVSYKRIDNLDEGLGSEVALLCQDNVKTLVNEDGVRVVITRSLVFDPEKLFNLSVSFGIDLKFNERKAEYDWKNIDLANEFRENGDFATAQIMSRISLVIGQITSSFGQQPLVLPAVLIKESSSSK